MRNIGNQRTNNKHDKTFKIVLELQAENARKMNINDFLRGNKIEENQAFEQFEFQYFWLHFAKGIINKLDLKC